MPRSPELPHDRRVQAVLLIQEIEKGLRQNQAAMEVSEICGTSLSPPKAVELKQYAEGEGWIKTVVLLDKIPQDLLAEAGSRRRNRHAALEKKLQRLSHQPRERVPRLRHLRVYATAAGGAKTSGEDQWGNALECFGHAVAADLFALINGSRVIGVGWGRTVAVAIDALAVYVHAHTQATGRARLRGRCQIAPTAGEPPTGVPDERSSSAIAQRLASVLGNGTEVPTLKWIPPIVPREFQDARRETLWDYLKNVSSYTDIFGEAGLISKLDAVLTSVGSFEQQVTSLQSAMVKLGHIDIERVKRLALGDLGGVLIERPGLKRQELDELREIRSLWTGIRPEDHERISGMAAQPGGRPGIVVIAIGANKAQIVSSVVQKGLVNELFIDDSLAQALST